MTQAWAHTCKAWLLLIVAMKGPLCDALGAAQGSGLSAQCSGLRAQGSGLSAQGSGLRAQGSGLRAQGSGLRAQGSVMRPLSGCVRVPLKQGVTGDTCTMLSEMVTVLSPQAWIILHNKQFLRMGSFLDTFGKLFFVDALEWLQGKHGFRAPEVPRQVRAWKKTLSHIKEDYADHFHDLISSHEYGLGKEQTKKWVDDFTNELIKYIDIKMGPWNQLPLCLGELLTTKFQSAVAQRIVREAPDDDDEACKYVPPAVWKAIK